MTKVLITETISELISKIDNEANFNIEITDDNVIKTTQFKIKTDNAKLLIGQNGESLSAINHLLKKIIERKTRDTEDSHFHFMLDVNDYNAKKIDDIKNKALLLADRARSCKTEVRMDPMSSYERMVVHSALADAKDIETVSFGDGGKRHVVIRCINDGF